MKKIIISFLFLMAVSLSAFAQGFYLDIGLGIGVKEWTSIEDHDMADVFKLSGSKLQEENIRFLTGSLKSGYGPFSKMPLYFVIEITGILDHYFDDYSTDVDMSYYFSSITCGPGFVFYPVPFIQLGSSIGYSWTGVSAVMRTDLVSIESGFEWMSGLAWNTSLAIDVGALWKGRNSVLLGVNYCYINNIFKSTLTNDAKWNSSMITVFLKYAFRKKPQSLF